MTSYINEHAHHILKSTTKKQRAVLSVFKGALGSSLSNSHFQRNSFVHRNLDKFKSKLNRIQSC